MELNQVRSRIAQRRICLQHAMAGVRRARPSKLHSSQQTRVRLDVEAQPVAGYNTPVYDFRILYIFVSSGGNFGPNKALAVPALPPERGRRPFLDCSQTYRAQLSLCEWRPSPRTSHARQPRATLSLYPNGDVAYQMGMLPTKWGYCDPPCDPPSVLGRLSSAHFNIERDARHLRKGE